MTRNVLKAVMIILQREMIKKKMDKYIEERVCNVKIRRLFVRISHHGRNGVMEVRRSIGFHRLGIV